MTKPFWSLPFALALVACTPGSGERCNPALFDSECASGSACIYPTAPVCGVAYCCTVDDSGAITDPHPNCQPDPTLACAPDASVEPAADLASVD